jgi:hypothetical protein
VLVGVGVLLDMDVGNGTSIDEDCTGADVTVGGGGDGVVDGARSEAVVVGGDAGGNGEDDSWDGGEDVSGNEEVVDMLQR